MRGESLRSALWVIWTSLRTEQRHMRGSPLVLIGGAIQPVVFLLITARTAHAAGSWGGAPPASSGPDRVTWLVSAVVLTSLWSSTVWLAGGVLRRERTFGTLARCVTSVHSARLVLFGKCLGATVFCMAAILASVTVTVLALGEPLRLLNPPLLVLALLITAVSGTALGMLVACLFLLTRHGLVWSSALVYPVFILGGLLIPRSALPAVLRWVPDLMSLRWLHEFFAAAAAGQVLAIPLAVACALTAGYYAVAIASLNRAIDAARRKGTLDLAW
jgi:ABC-2 type transport system permease protein